MCTVLFPCTRTYEGPREEASVGRIHAQSCVSVASQCLWSSCISVRAYGHTHDTPIENLIRFSCASMAGQASGGAGRGRRQQPWPTKRIAAAALALMFSFQITNLQLQRSCRPREFLSLQMLRKASSSGPSTLPNPESHLLNLPYPHAVASLFVAGTQCTFLQDCIRIRGRSEGGARLPTGHEPREGGRETGSMCGAAALHSSVAKSFCMVWFPWKGRTAERRTDSNTCILGVYYHSPQCTVYRCSNKRIENQSSTPVLYK